MNDRSSLAQVRNPVLTLPAMAAVQALPPEARAALAAVLRDISLDARQRAQKSWRQNKGPMAAYWKAVGAYAHHLFRAAKAESRS